MDYLQHKPVMYWGGEFEQQQRMWKLPSGHCLSGNKFSPGATEIKKNYINLLMLSRTELRLTSQALLKQRINYKTMCQP